MTFALFWLMQALVVVEDRAPIPKPEFTIGPYVKVHQPPRPVETRKPKPELPELREEPPTPHVEPAPTRDDGNHGLFPIDPVNPTDPSERRDEHAGPREFDRNAVPLVRITPNYPSTALRRGIEGRVLLEFTIGRTGTVENAKVIAAEPNSIFNEAALKAVRQWRYEPKIENGRAVEQHGIQISIPFLRDSS